MILNFLLPLPLVALITFSRDQISYLQFKNPQIHKMATNKNGQFSLVGMS